MLWQHDPAQPIGVWDEVREDERGLFVKGRILTEVERGREAVALIEAGAIDGLSIGYRTLRSVKDGKGGRQRGSVTNLRALKAMVLSTEMGCVGLSLKEKR